MYQIDLVPLSSSSIQWMVFEMNSMCHIADIAIFATGKLMNIRLEDDMQFPALICVLFLDFW